MSQLNLTHNPVLGAFYCKEHCLDNWQNLNGVCELETSNVSV